MSQRCDFGHRVNCMHQPKAFFFFPQPHAPGHYGHSRGNLAIQRKLPPLHSTDQPKWPETLLKMTQSHQQSSHCFSSDYQGCGTERCVNRDPDIYRHTGTCPRPGIWVPCSSLTGRVCWVWQEAQQQWYLHMTHPLCVLVCVEREVSPQQHR